MWCVLQEGIKRERQRRAASARDSRAVWANGKRTITGLALEVACAEQSVLIACRHDVALYYT